MMMMSFMMMTKGKKPVHVNDFTKCWQDLGSVAEDVDADNCN